MRANRNLNVCVRSVSVFLRHLLAVGQPVRFAVTGLAGGAVLSLGGCAQPPGQRLVSANSKEYFPSSIYGAASPRVVADGEPVPRGGGMYMVGKPYSVAGHTYYPSEKHYAAIGPCLLVRRCLSWPPDRQWRGLRPRFDFRRASDDALAKLRAGHQSAQQSLADRPRQRSRAVCRQSHHGCFQEDRRGARFPPKRNVAGQGRIYRRREPCRVG